MVTQQDGSYDWSAHAEDQGNETRAFMANISEEIQSEDKESKSDMETDQDDRMEQAEVAATSE